MSRRSTGETWLRQGYDQDNLNRSQGYLNDGERIGQKTHRENLKQREQLSPAHRFALEGNFSVLQLGSSHLGELELSSSHLQESPYPIAAAKKPCRTCSVCLGERGAIHKWQHLLQLYSVQHLQLYMTSLTRVHILHIPWLPNNHCIFIDSFTPHTIFRHVLIAWHCLGHWEYRNE